MSEDRTKLAFAELDKIAATLEQRFKEGRRVLSFSQYLELFASDPARYGRDAARYVRDMFDHYGTRVVQKPWGQVTRYTLSISRGSRARARTAPIRAGRTPGTRGATPPSSATRSSRPRFTGASRTSSRRGAPTGSS